MFTHHKKDKYINNKANIIAAEAKVSMNFGEEVKRDENTKIIAAGKKKRANESQLIFMKFFWKNVYKNTRRIHLININPILGMCCGFSSSK